MNVSHAAATSPPLSLLNPPKLLVLGGEYVGRTLLRLLAKGADHAAQLVISSTHVLIVGDILEFGCTCQTEYSGRRFLMKHTNSA